MNIDLVSIIMPSYNAAAYICEAIQSVISQTYENWELIIVDDCSVDSTEKIVRDIQDVRIRYIKNEKNLGAAVSRNIALKKAKGKWVAFLDSDDIWMPEKLERQIIYMQSNGYMFSYTNYIEIDKNSNYMGVKVTGPKQITRKDMFKYCWPGCLTVMYDRERIGVVQINDIKKNNDYAMWLKISKFADCYLLDEVLAAYRKGRNDSISSCGYMSLIKWHYRLFRKAEDMNIIFSVWYTCLNIIFGIYKKNRYLIKCLDQKGDKFWNVHL